MREQDQKRDRRRLIVDYRKKFLDSFVRGGDEEAKQAHLTPTLSPSDAERENAPRASRLAGEIEELSGESPGRIA